MSCKVISGTNEKESVLYNKLLKVLGTHELAEDNFARVMSDEFKDFFGDWVGEYKSGYSNDPQMNERVGPTGEPKLFFKNNQYYFQGKNGDKLFVNRLKFPEFTLEQVEEVTNQLLYDYVTQSGNKSFNELDTESGLKPADLLPSIEKSMNDYKEVAKDYPEMIARADLVLKNKKDFETEVFNKLESLGQSVRGRVETTEDMTDETSEVNNDNVLDLRASFERNSKENATVNTKLFLSQISDVAIEDGRYVTTYGDFLAKSQFVDFNEVWSTLEPRLSDIVGHGYGDNVNDVFDLMLLELEKLEFTKPWVIDLINKLDELNEDKKTEFVQAFSKTKLNFHVTTVDGDSYRVMNVTESNSRRSKVLNDWLTGFDNIFKASVVGMNENNIKMTVEIQRKLVNDWRKFKDGFKPEVNKSHPENAGVLVTAAEDLINTFSRLGVNLSVDDFNSFIMFNGDPSNSGSFRTIDKLYKSLNFMLKDLMTKKSNLLRGEDLVNPFANENYLKDFAESISLSNTDVSENTVVMNDGKTAWTYATPSYISNKINSWKSDRQALEELSAIPYNNNSLWISYLLGTDQERPHKMAVELSENRLKELSIGLSSSFKSQNRNDAVDNKEISYPDAVNDSIVKLLGKRMGNNKSQFTTIVPADKSRKIDLTGLPLFDSNIDVSDGKLSIPEETLDVFVNYFSDEYTRMKIVAGEIDSLPDHKKIVHYHTGNMNGLKSQIFPELSYDNKNLDPELRAALYDANGRPFSTTLSGLDNNQKLLLKEEVRKNLTQLIRNTLIEFRSVDNISKKVKDYYSNKFNNQETALAGDYVVNGLISSIEFMKLFSGDPAYYKNNADLIKRIPATYTDGLQLRLSKKDHLFFNQATISGVEVASKYVDLIKDSVKDKSIVSAYKKVNTTDAQAWITPNRWRFLKKRLGQWSPLHDKVFTKMMGGEALTRKELKLAAQPLKGVYFEINNGRPVYLKYSQAVLIPSLVKGTPMQALYDKMTKDANGKEFENPKDEIHEVVTIDGVKVGSTTPDSIHNDGSTELATDFTLAPVSLSNRGWKLQQDLPIKGLKATKVGSQIQKNILSSINLKGSYNFNGNEVSGQTILDEIHATVSQLSNAGKESLQKEFSIKDGKITDMSRVYSALIDEFKSRGGGDNIIQALEKEMPLDAIPQVRGKIQSIFMSIMNKELTQIKTNGASLIQVSPFGLETISDDSGIKIVSPNYDGKGLKPPRIENGVVKPGQAMIPYSALRSILKRNDVDYDNLTGQELMQYIDPSALQAISYRIPNQGMSSNDALEIVGILPDSMGDSIIAYDGVPAKTGSDFDIDKMFVMMHNLEFKDGKVQKIQSDTTKKGIQNRLVDLYSSILTSPNTYDDMMRSIDSDFLKDDINSLFPEDSKGNLQMFSPIDQIKTKFSYISGKFGVAQTANQAVDHVINQTQNIRLNGSLGIGHVDEDGNTKFDNIKDVEGKHKIIDVLSAFLNAYVDIAKDPYISRGNHNSVTSNTAFMLIRAGVPIDWVNRFIGQPILIELVETMRRSEGITSEPLKVDGKHVNAFAFLRHKYSMEKSKSPQSLVSSLTKSTLSKNIGKDVGASVSQSEVLDAFEFFIDQSKFFGASVMSSKADVNGGGGSFMHRLTIQNRFTDVLEKDKILGFEDKFDNTMLGTYHSNSVDWVGNVVSNSDIFLSASQGLEDTFNSISNRMGKGPLLVDKNIAHTLDSAYYAYAMSGTSMFRMNLLEFDDLFVKLPNKIIEMKEEYDNFLLNEIRVRSVRGRKFLSIDSRNKPSIYKDKIHRAWMELYTSDEFKSVAIDLVRHAYSQSGFKQTLNELYSVIPHEILIENGIQGDVKNMMIDVRDSVMDERFRDQFFRNNYDNPTLVASVSGRNVKPIKGFPTSSGFLYDPSTEGNSISTGKNEKGIDTYPEFVTRKITPDPTRPDQVEVFLYKLIGSYKSDDVQLPAYSRTHKLGSKSIVEYSYNNVIHSSVVASNNLNDFTAEKRNKFNIFVSQSEGHIPADIFMDASNKIENKKKNPLARVDNRVHKQMGSLATQHIGDVYDNQFMADSNSGIYDKTDVVMVTGLEGDDYQIRFAAIEDNIHKAMMAGATFLINNKMPSSMENLTRNFITSPYNDFNYIDSGNGDFSVLTEQNCE